MVITAVELGFTDTTLLFEANSKKDVVLESRVLLYSVTEGFTCGIGVLLWLKIAGVSGKVVCEAVDNK